jgi:hypothetical protein
LGVVDSHLVVSIPYLSTPSDLIRGKLRKGLVVLIVIVILTAWVGLASAIVFQLPIDFLRLDKTEADFSPVRQ